MRRTAIVAALALILAPLVLWAEISPADPKYGDLFAAGDVSVVIQAALDDAAAKHERVAMPAVRVEACNLRVSSLTEFVGAGRGTEIIAPNGCAGFIVGNKNKNAERLRIADMWLQGNEEFADVSGVVIDSDGGDWTGADPEITLQNILVTNVRRNGFEFKGSRAIHAFNLRARGPGGHGFAFLQGTVPSVSFPGLVDSTTDGVFTDLSAEGAGLDLLYMETGANQFLGFKGGQADRYGIWCTASCHFNNFTSFEVDGLVSMAWRMDGHHNICQGCNVHSASGTGIVFGSSAFSNDWNGWVYTFAQNGVPTDYAVRFEPGSRDNRVRLAAQNMMLGLLDPASVLGSNRLETLTADGSAEWVGRLVTAAGSPGETVLGGQLPIRTLISNGDAVAGSFPIRRDWRGKPLQATILYSTNLGDATGTLALDVTGSSMAIGSYVVEVDVASTLTTPAPPEASRIYSACFTIPVGLADEEGALTIKRGASSSLATGVRVQIHGVRIEPVLEAQ